jgi:hypothetical protein
VLRPLLEATFAEQARLAVALQRRRLLEVVLFALALPTLVPSLLVMRLMAKRWGRVDFLLVAADLLVICVIASPTPMFVPALLSSAAAGAVFIMRYPRAAQGIVLGFPGSVIHPAMLGGALVLGSLGYLQSWDGLGRHLQRALPPRVDARGLRALPTGSVARVRVAALDQEHPIFCDRGRCVDHDPRVAVEVPAAEVQGRAASLLGGLVRVPGCSPERAFMRDGFLHRTTTATTAPATTDVGLRLHAPVAGTQARLWIASEPGAAALPSGDCEGLLVVAQHDQAFAREWSLAWGRRPLPAFALTILSGAGVPPDLERWLPLRGGHRRAWVALPASAPRLASTRGVVRGGPGVEAPLAALDDEPRDGASVLAIGLEAPPALPSVARPSVLAALAALLAGLLAIALSLRLAWHESG